MTVIKNLSVKPVKGKYEEIRYYHVRCDKDYPYGRMMTRIGEFVQGKRRINRDANNSTFNRVIVVNCKGAPVPNNKYFYKHTGFPGGLKVKNYEDNQHKSETSQFITFKRSLRCMLPNNTQGKTMSNNVKFVYEDIDHLPKEQGKKQQLALAKLWREK